MATKTKPSLIVENPKIMNGHPTFAGRRLTLKHFKAHLDTGYSPEEYASIFRLEPEKVEAGLAWLRDRGEI